MLALDRYVAKALPEVVLGAIAPAVSLIAADRQHHVAVLAVVSQNFLETACHIEKLVVLAQSALYEQRLEVGGHQLRHFILAELALLADLLDHNH